MNKKTLGAAIAVVLFVVLPTYVWLLTDNQLSMGYNKGYMPDQPIPYSHEVHAGKYKMDCKYCHANVETSRHASVPSLNVCMNCHMVVKTDSPHIQRLMAAYNSGENIAWEKVNLLPDHVKFNHSAHIRAGKDCKECHGAVEEMTKVYQKEDLSMGWCINCHRKPENDAPVTCSTCHY